MTGVFIRVVHAVVAQTLVANTGPGLNSNRVNCSVTTNLKQGTTDFPLLAWELVDDGSYGPQSYGALCRSHGRVRASTRSRYGRIGCVGHGGAGGAGCADTYVRVQRPRGSVLVAAGCC